MKKFITLLFIIVAGETIFMLPFLIPRLFRPLMLEAWSLTNTDIGIAFSAYGFSSMASYILGGPFADKYPPRLLIVLSLLLTALGGIPLILFPSKLMLIATYFLWGISTIFLMWGALIKVTHVFGGEENRSGAMGILDSGRGLTAALMSSFLVWIISGKELSVNAIFMTTISFTIIIAIGVWFSLKGFRAEESVKRDWSFEKAKIVLKDSNVWLLGVIVLSSYCGYKSIDNYSVYLVDVQKVSLIKSSMFTSAIFWIRPLSAFISGILTDKVKKNITGGRFLTLLTLLLLGSLLQLLLALKVLPTFNMIFTTILFSAAFAYALRAIYFAVFGALNIPENLIGTTVGIVSLVGFMPDFFFGAITGHLIDTYPGEQGYTYTFYLTSGFLFIGALACFLSYKKSVAFFRENSI